MLTAQGVLDRYFLDNRCMLIEIAAMLDRHDRAAASDDAGKCASDPRMDKVYQALSILATPSTAPNRAEQLLMLFSDPAD